MKNTFLLICTLLCGTIMFAQTGKTTSKTTGAKPPAAAPKATLKTLNDSASYAVGLSLANFYKQQGITSLNTALISRAITDVFNSKPCAIDGETANNVMNNYMTNVQEKKSKPAIEQGRAFLKTNKTKAGVKTTASGLQYEVITEGTGAKPIETDSVVAHYRGTLLDGTPFDDSYARGEPITFSLKSVIRGWTEGLQLMSIGSKYRFYIPYELGYGAFDYGPIPGGSMLTFDVELLEIRKPKN